MIRSGMWLALLWASGSLALAQSSVTLTPRVDERVELMSTLARLAGYDEYTGRQHTAYVTAIDQHFAPYQRHPAVAYMQEVRTRRNIGYDAVMAYAVQLSGAPNWTALIPFARQLPDPRWTAKDADKLVGLIRAAEWVGRCYKALIYSKLMKRTHCVCSPIHSNSPGAT